MGKKGDSITLEPGMVVGARRAGVSISQSTQVLGFSHITISKVYREWSEKEKIHNEWQFCGGKCLGDMSRLENEQICSADKATATQNNHSLQPRFAEEHL